MPNTCWAPRQRLVAYKGVTAVMLIKNKDSRHYFFSKKVTKKQNEKLAV